MAAMVGTLRRMESGAEGVELVRAEDRACARIDFSITTAALRGSIRRAAQLGDRAFGGPLEARMGDYCLPLPRSRHRPVV